MGHFGEKLCGHMPAGCNASVKFGEVALSGYGRMNRVRLCYRNECGTVVLKLFHADVRQTTTTDRDYSLLNFGQFKVECLKGSTYHKYVAYLNNYQNSDRHSASDEF